MRTANESDTVVARLCSVSSALFLLTHELISSGPCAHLTSVLLEWACEGPVPSPADCLQRAMAKGRPAARRSQDGGRHQQNGEDASGQQNQRKVLDRGVYKLVKDCQHCGRPMTWRKKWERCWDSVQYCSDRCRKVASAERKDERRKERRLQHQHAVAESECVAATDRDA